MVEHSATGRTFTLNPNWGFTRMLTTLAANPLMPHIVFATSQELPDPTLCGAYLEQIQTILINESMLDVQQRCTLIHELFHWVHADTGCATRYGAKQEQHVRQETALFLINPVEYMRAENTYNADTYCIARELNVTVSIVEDYRRAIQQSGYVANMARDY